MKIHISMLCLLITSVVQVMAQKITFAPQWTPQSQFAGYYAALENGYYADAGLDVSIKHPTTSYSSMSMLEDGTADIITSELIQAMMRVNDDVRLVNLLQTTQHSTLVLISRAKNVSTFSDLAKSRIGTWKIGFSEIPHMIDKEQNLDIEWVNLINSLNLYIAGAIDATLAKSYNELIQFLMSGITPGNILYFSEHGYDFPEDGLYVSEEFFKKNPEKCLAFADASRKGWEWVRKNREEALDIVMKYVRQENIPTNRYHQKWMLDAILVAQEDVKGGKPSYKLNEDIFNELVALLRKYGYITESVVYERFIGGNL